MFTDSACLCTVCVHLSLMHQELLFMLWLPHCVWSEGSELTLHATYILKLNMGGANTHCATCIEHDLHLYQEGVLINACTIHISWRH